MGVNGSQYDVQVRLSTVGQNDLSAGVKNARDAMAGLAEQLNKADDGGRRLSATFRGVDEAGQKYSVTMRQLADSSRTYSGTAEQLASMVGKLAVAWESLSVIKDFVGDMFQATKAHEDMVTTMAATMTATNGWASSISVASTQLEKLKETAALVNGTEEQMVGAFTMLKRTFGGTSDEAVTLTEKLALLARQSGASIDDLATRLAAASITGKLQTRGTAGIALTGAGIDPQTLMTIKDAGQAMEYLNAVIADNPELVERLKEGWSYLTAEFKKNREEALETIGQGLEPLKESLKELNAALSSEESQRGFNTMGSNLARLTTQMKEISSPEGAQGFVSYWQRVGDVAIATLSAILASVKLFFDTVSNLAVMGWQFVTHPIKSATSLDELKLFLSNEVDAFKDAETKIVTSWKMAMGTLPVAPKNGSAPGGEFDSITSENPTKPGGGNRNLSQKWEDAKRKYEDFVSALQAKFSTSGLDGLDLALAKDEEQWTKNEAAINDAQRTLDAAARAAGKSSTPFDALASSLHDLNDKQKALAESKDLELWAQKYDDAMAKIQSVVKDTELGRIDDTFIENARKISNAFNDAMRAIQTPKEAPNPFDPPTVQAWLDYDNKVAAAQEARDQAMARNLDLWRMNENKVLAERRGDYQAYYDSIVEMDVANHMTLFQAEQDASKKSADLMYSQADTLEKGWRAGLEKVKASIVSFGQDAADSVVSLASSIKGTVGSGIADLIGGDFGKLKSDLKGLWDSILQDFSKMLANMLERWVLTGDAMGSGQGSSGIFSKLLGGSGQGSNAVYTPGGTANQGEGWAPVYGAGASMGAYQTSGNASWLSGSTNTGSGGLGVAGYGALAAYGVGLYQGLSSIGTPHTTSTPTYGGQNLGQTADFGGLGGGAALQGAMTVLTAAAAYTVLTAAAVSATVPVIGWIAAAILLVVAAVMAIFDGPTEGHIYASVSEAFDKSGAKSVIGTYVSQIIGATSDFVGQLAFKAAGPEGVAGYVASYQKAFADAYGQAKFDIHAGSAEDLQKDVNAFFQTVLPTLAMKAAFGQTGFGMNGNGDIAGISWNTNNGLMDAQGNWVKKQLYDPNAPIPMMLTGLGFSADKIGEIAQKLAAGEDIKTFETYLTNLVGVVVDLGDLAKQFGRTTQEWFDFIKTAAAQQGTAAEFTPAIANLKAEGLLLETMFGDDQVTQAQTLVKDSQTLLGNMAQALQSIYSMIDTIRTTTDSTIESYKNKLLSAGELEAQARGAYLVDVKAIAAAANPKEVQAAWQQVMKDLSTVLDAIVARIQTIQTLQQGYADFRTQMADAAGPQFATDPQAWLAKNQAAIDAIDWSDPIKGAQTLLDLEKTRYSNLIGMLGQIDSAIQNITNSFQSSITNLQLQAMGSVTTDASGKKVWTPDVHAQGEFLNSQIQALMAQYGTATTPEQVNAITSQIQALISQLAAQPQDPTHYAESREVLIKMSQDAQKAALEALGKMHDAVTEQLKGIGDQLKLGETALAGALDAAQKDFTRELGLMTTASAAATKALTGFADDLTKSMNDLTDEIRHWIWVMTHPDGTPDPYYHESGGVGYTAPTPGGGQDTGNGLWEDDPDDPTQQRRLTARGTYVYRKKPKLTGDQPGGRNALATTGAPAAAPPPSASTSAVPPVSVSVTVKGSSPEEIARAAADLASSLAFSQTLNAIKTNNVEIVRVIRNNPSLIRRAGSSAA